MRTQVRHLVRRFTARATKMRTRMDMPPTPSSSAGSPSSSSKQNGKDVDNVETDEVITVNRTANMVFEADRPSNKSTYFACPTSFCGKSGSSGVLDPQGSLK